jgi:hypothetical protein
MEWKEARVCFHSIAQFVFLDHNPHVIVILCFSLFCFFLFYANKELASKIATITSSQTFRYNNNKLAN